MKRYLPFLIVFFILTLLVIDSQAQCSMCSAVVSSNMDDQADATGKGINKGILFLMAFPYLALMGFLYVFYREKIKAFSGRLFKQSS